MFNYFSDYYYLKAKSAELFTVTLTPDKVGTYPIVVVRTPYVDGYENTDEEIIMADYLREYMECLKRGYAVVVQHCRGRGKSTGDCIPYINEREDGLNLLDWIREQSFYQGEIYLKGVSYLTSVHYATAPFADDIKGAAFGVQDCERYNICYRNGFLKKALHCEWYVGMYKAKSKLKKNCTEGTFEMLPLSDFSKTVFGESAEDFDMMLKAPNRDNEFWNTRYGGSDARNAIRDAKIPILCTTGLFDIYTGGVFDMWNSMSEETRNKSALIVSAYDHGDSCDTENSMIFPKGKKVEQFGENYEIDWFDEIRNNESYPFARGKVTYYSLFENKWMTDDFADSESFMDLTLGNTKETYLYNPFAPARFRGGLSCNFGGSVFQDRPNSRYDIISVYTDKFEKDIFVKGKMSAKLTVLSDCEDTCFYIRISIEKERGDLGLRDDITSICYQLGDYKKNTEVELSFNFDEIAFLIKKGERLRVDISSADAAHYVRHTNNKGLYSEQTTAKVAHNTVDLSKSVLKIPVKNQLPE